MFINVATEAITAIMITLLLSFDKFCFISIFEQSDFFVLKNGFVLVLFTVAFIDVAGTDFDFVVVVAVVAIVIVDVLGVCVAGANLVIGSWTEKCLVFIILGISLYPLNLSNFLYAEKQGIGSQY